MPVPATALAQPGYDDPEIPAQLAPAELTLIQMLEAQAATEGLSGVELARQIGVDQSFWSRARRGIERFGPTSCAKIVARYPHMAAAAARYLAELFAEGGLTLNLMREADRIARHAQRGAPVEDDDDGGSDTPPR